MAHIKNALVKLQHFVTVLALTTTVAFAQTNLNKSAQFPNAQVPAFSEAKHARSFEINPALQSAAGVAKGERVMLQLFENQTYNAVIKDISTAANGSLTISFAVPDYPFAVGFVCTGTSGVSLFSLNIPELNKRFVSRQSIYSQNAYLLELREEYGNYVNNDQAPPTPIEIMLDNPQTQKKNDGMSFLDTKYCYNTELSGNDPAHIDLLILYTPAAKAWADLNTGGIENAISAAMALTKAVIDNQGDGDEFKVVHTQLVDYVEADFTNLSIDLIRLFDPVDGYLDEAAQLRKQHSAALVTLIGAYHEQKGGLGQSLDKATCKQNGSIGTAFSVVNVRVVSSSTSLIHEIGHNMGMLHNLEDVEAEIIPYSLYPYAYGYYWTGNDSKEYGSVMSYRGTRVPYFSNPNIIYAGKPAGSATANNAQVFRNTKHIVASYSDRVQNLLEAPKITVSKGADPTVSWNVAGAVQYRIKGLTATFGTTPNTGASLSYLKSFGLFPPECDKFTVSVSAENECSDVGDAATITFLADGTIVSKNPLRTITFAGENISIAQQTVEEGNYVTKPADPVRANYIFDGWYTDNITFLNKWDFATNVVTKNITLYAKWNCVHNFSVPHTDLAATCTKKGEGHYTCSLCGATGSNYDIPALGHDYRTNVTAPTCTEKGYTTHTCSRGDHMYYTDTIEALGHNFSVWIVNINNTNEEIEVCSRCSEPSGNARESVCEHAFTAWGITTAPTCGKAGSKTEKCAVCGIFGTVTQIIPATNEHTFVWTTTTKATCETDGTETEFCSKCNAQGTTRQIAKLEHIFGDWNIQTAATCTQFGKETRICSLCGKSENQPIDKLPHAFTDWKITMYPLCGYAGEKIEQCAVCGELGAVTEEIPATGEHTYIWNINPDNEHEEIGFCTTCGTLETRPITAIEIITNDEHITVHPNPTDGQLTIVGANNFSPAQTVEIYDYAGRLVETVRATSLYGNELTIDISHITNGVYFIQINGARVKIVKQ